MMKFAIALLSPAHHPATRRALRFAEATLSAGHQISRIFLYQDGVHTASGNIVAPQDECNMSREWRTFIQQHQLDGVVCIAAALRRGVLNEQERQRHDRQADNLAAPWQLSGLGQLHDACQDADRLVCFGGQS